MARLGMVLAVSLVCLPGTVAAQAAHPIFIITPARREAWANLGAAGHPWTSLAATNCGLTDTSGERYGDDGFWCGLISAMTGDASATQKAIARHLRTPRVPSDPNAERQDCGAHVILASWLYPTMTQAQRDSSDAILRSWMRWGIKGTGQPYLGGFRTSDGDQSTTTYLCAALTDRYLGTHWLDSTETVQGSGLLGGLGNLAAPGRASLERYAQMCAAGGEWDESTEYNLNTLMLVALDYEALRPLGDSLPTLRRCLDLAAQRSPWEITPDLLQAVQWGDEEHPRDFAGPLYERVTLNVLLAGITHSPIARGTVARLVAKYGATGYNTAEPAITGSRVLEFLEPSAPIDSSAPQGTWYAPGRGHLWSQHGASLFFAEAQPPTGEDHQVGYVFGHQLYRNGEWVIQNPIGYGAPFNLGNSTNGVVYAGFGAMASKTFERFDSNGVACVTGSTSGSLYAPGYYDPPPPFLQIGRRTTCYLQVDGVDIIVTRDSVAIGKPTRRDRYYPSELQRMDTTGGWFAVWHPIAMPERAGNTWVWATAGGQEVRLSVFSGGVITDSVLNEHQLWPEVKANPTLGYQLRLRTTGSTLTTVAVVGSALPVTQTAAGVQVGKTLVTISRTRVSVATVP